VVTRPHWFLGVALLAALAFATGGPAATVAPCHGAQLSGTFKVIPGSAGAGNIVYTLRLKNRSTATCFVSGLVKMQLLGKYGRALPTHVVPVFRGGLTAVRVVLAPGKSAKATARFSPDIPGPGEPQVNGACERTSYKVRVTPPPGGGTLIAPVLPPTPVCEHGGLQVSALSHA
jgi:hypothetical protein